MSEQKNPQVWLFEFGLEQEDGSAVDKGTAAELLDTIQKWAEDHGCQVGGGFRRPTQDELDGEDPFALPRS